MKSVFQKVEKKIMVRSRGKNREQTLSSSSQSLPIVNCY